MTKHHFACSRVFGGRDHSPRIPDEARLHRLLRPAERLNAATSSPCFDRSCRAKTRALEQCRSVAHRVGQRNPGISDWNQHIEQLRPFHCFGNRAAETDHALPRPSRKRGNPSGALAIESLIIEPPLASHNEVRGGNSIPEMHRPGNDIETRPDCRVAESQQPKAEPSRRTGAGRLAMIGIRLIAVSRISTTRASAPFCGE